MVSDIGLLAASLAVSISAYAAAHAEACIGAAAIGATAEKPDTFSKNIIMLVIPETLAVFGFVTALIILFVV